MKKSDNLLNMDEDRLVEAARSDPQAFGELYRRYLTPLYRYLLSRSGNVEDAEDLCAQTFSEALQGLVQKRYRPGGCFAAWLFTIARRRLIDFYRRHPQEKLADLPSPQPGLMETLEKEADLQRLARLLQGLDEERRELLRLRFSAGLSFSQISLLDGRSEAAVKMALYRTLDFLREHWEDPNE